MAPVHEESALRPLARPAGGGPAVLDTADEALLAVLLRDGRAPLAELRAATGKSETSVRRRLERLRATGVLHLAVEYDHEPLGQGAETLCWLAVAPRGLEAAGRAVAEWPEVRFAAAVSGRISLAVSVLCRTNDHLYTVVGERLAALPEVTAAETTVTLRRLKSVTRNRT